MPLNPADPFFESALQQIVRDELNGGDLSIRVRQLQAQRIVRGRVGSTGTVIDGTGWTVTHPSTGHYTVTPSVAFHVFPVVVCSLTQIGTNLVAFDAAGSSVSSLLFQTFTTAGASIDSSFSFVAVGR